MDKIWKASCRPAPLGSGKECLAINFCWIHCWTKILFSAWPGASAFAVDVAAASSEM